jgi:hypothetical protein
MTVTRVASDIRKARAAEVKIEITPEMIEAAVDAYRARDREFDQDDMIVTQVFQAMAMASRRPRRAGASGCRLIPQSHWWHS